jgi:hypothetical protein
MDGQRFDDLARLFARPATRRTLWRGALAAVAGRLTISPLQPVSAQDGCAPASSPCDDATPCCGAPDNGCCGGVCTSLLETSNCGSCGNTCQAGDLCCGGVCIPSLDPNNCGACDVTCDSCESCIVIASTGIIRCVNACGNGITTHIGSVCVDGECVCPSGQVPCQDFKDENQTLYCADPLTDDICCGVGPERVRCPEDLVGSICVNGDCVCPDGNRPCGGTCCPNDSVCSDFGCGQCAEGQVPCNDRCVDLATDTANCGACGTACDAGSLCVDGVCQASGGGGQPPPPVPTSTAGPVTLPGTGTGARGRPSGQDNTPLVGAVVALGAAAAAFLHARLHRSETADHD